MFGKLSRIVKEVSSPVDTFPRSIRFGLAQSHVQKRTQKDAPTTDSFISYRMRRLSHLAFDKLDYHKLFCLFRLATFHAAKLALCFERSRVRHARSARCPRVSEQTRTQLFINQTEPVRGLPAPIESASMFPALVSRRIEACPFRGELAPPRSEGVQS